MVDMEIVPTDDLRHRSRSVRNAWPPTGTAQLGRWTLGTLGELPVVRAGLRQALGRQQLPDAVREAVREKIFIVAGELAAEAVADTKPPATMELFRTDTTFIVDVSDNDPWAAPRCAEDAGGPALRLTGMLSLDMGWYLDGGGTRCVWAQVAIPPAGRGPVRPG